MFILNTKPVDPSDPSNPSNKKKRITADDLDAALFSTNNKKPSESPVPPANKELKELYKHLLAHLNSST